MRNIALIALAVAATISAAALDGRLAHALANGRQKNASDHVLVVQNEAHKRRSGSLEAVIPRPRENWRGVKHPNYKTMYWEYTVPLHCVGGHNGLPVGVFGFYYWLSVIWQLLNTTATAVRAISRTKNGRKDAKYVSRVVHGIIATIQFIVELVLTSRRVGGCRSSLIGLTSTDGSTIASNLAPTTYIQKIIFTQIVTQTSAAILSFELVWPRISAKWMIPLIIIALGSNFFITSFFYAGYPNFLYTDKSMLYQALATSIPISALIIIPAITISLIVSIRKSFLAGLASLLLVLTLGFHIISTGIGFIQLGRTVNDPWGSQIVTDKIGKVIVVFVSLFPVLGTISTAVNLNGS